MRVAGLQETEAPADAGDFADLFSLLWRHRRDEGEDTLRMARSMAGACAGENHLWEDMALPDRATLSDLIRRHFPVLYHKNRDGMRWKKFFYRQLCGRAGARVCKAPSCGACGDYAACFGPE